MGGNSVAWAAVIAPTLEETPLTHLGEAQGKIVHMPLFAAVPVILHLSYRGLYIKQLCRYKRAVSQPQIQPPGSHNQGASTPISPFPGFVPLSFLMMYPVPALGCHPSLPIAS